MRRALLTALAIVGLSSTAWAQVPAPPPELSVLKQLEGVWDAVVKTGNEESKAVMEAKFGLGGLWLVSDFQGEAAGQKFAGKGLDTYDPSEKKYVAVWADSMSLSPMIMKGDYDAAKKTLTSVGEARDPTGNVMKLKSVAIFKDHDSHEWSLSMILPDGMETPMLSISYKRRK